VRHILSCVRRCASFLVVRASLCVVYGRACVVVRCVVSCVRRCAAYPVVRASLCIVSGRACVAVRRIWSCVRRCALCRVVRASLITSCPESCPRAQNRALVPRIYTRSGRRHNHFGSEPFLTLAAHIVRPSCVPTCRGGRGDLPQSSSLRWISQMRSMVVLGCATQAGVGTPRAMAKIVVALLLTEVLCLPTAWR